MRLFLSNSGTRRSLSVTTDCASNFSANVLNDLGELRSFGIIPCGKAERFIKHALEPESSKTLSSLQLRSKPIVSAVQIVAGHWFNDCNVSTLLSLLSESAWYSSSELLVALSVELLSNVHCVSLSSLVVNVFLILLSPPLV